MNHKEHEEHKARESGSNHNVGVCVHRALCGSILHSFAPSRLCVRSYLRDREHERLSLL
jgi:hypothetical protein